MPSTLFSWDCEELAAHLLGLDPDDYNMDDIEEKLYDKYEISFDSFCLLVEQLVNFTVPIETAFGNKYQGFVDVKHNNFIVKVPYE